MSNKAVSITEVIDGGRVSAQQIIIVVLCLIFNMVDGLDITAMAVTVHQIGEEMQLGADRLGLVFSFSLAGMMLGAMFLAGFSDVIGRRSMIIITLVLVGSTVLMTAYVNSLYMLIAVRFASGLGAGAMLASVATLAAEYSPEKYRALSVTAVTAGYPLGAVMTGFVATAIIPDFGWRGVFVFGGSVTLLLAVTAFMLIPESLQFLCRKQPKGALETVNKIMAKLSREPLPELPGVAPDDSNTGADTQNILQKMLSLLTPGFRRKTLLLWCAFFLYISTLYVLMSWVPKMIINLGYEPEVGNLAFSMFNFGGFLGIISLGYMASRWMLSTLITIFAVIATLLMWFFAAAASMDASQVVLMVLIFVIGFTLQGGYTGMYAVAAKIYPIEIRSTGVGWAIGLGRFGAVIGPAVAGFMIASGLSVTFNFVVFAIPMLLGGVLAYLLRVR